MCSSISSVLPTNMLEDNSYVASFNHLLEMKIHVDVTFVLENEDSDTKTKFFAHKLILSMRSPYFEDKFYGGKSNKESYTFHLKKINSDYSKALNDLIRYCYGNYPQLETAQEIYTLFKLAFRFKVVSLMNLCHTKLISMKIEPKNVFTILKFSEVTHNERLADKCDSFLIASTREVMTAYKLCDVTPNMVYLILDLTTLSLDSEYELLKWVFDWAKVKARERDFGCKSTREYLEELLTNMDFLTLTHEEFAELCNDNPDFFSLDEIASVYLNIAKSGSCKMPDWYDSDLEFRIHTGSRKLSNFNAGQSVQWPKSIVKLNNITNMILKNGLGQCRKIALKMVESFDQFHDVIVSMLKDLQSAQGETLEEIQSFREMKASDAVD